MPLGDDAYGPDPPRSKVEALPLTCHPVADIADLKFLRYQGRGLCGLPMVA